MSSNTAEFNFKFYPFGIDETKTVSNAVININNLPLPSKTTGPVPTFEAVFVCLHVMSSNSTEFDFEFHPFGVDVTNTYQILELV